jgi:hypothetical protein
LFRCDAAIAGHLDTACVAHQVQKLIHAGCADFGRGSDCTRTLVTRHKCDKDSGLIVQLRVNWCCYSCYFRYFGPISFRHTERVGGDNHDDFLIRVNVAAVPLPAGGLLLIGALGGLAVLRRRKTCLTPEKHSHCMRSGGPRAAPFA